MPRILAHHDLIALLAAAGLPSEAAHATLGEILRAEHPGRTDPGQRTVYGPVGLPWQDLALAWLAYREAERRGLGIEVDLLGPPSGSVSPGGR